jgi:heptosyltransferase-3
MRPLQLASQPKILVVALRRLGDVLLATPLIASLRAAWPDATIDALVFDNSAGILAGNPDLSADVTMPARPTTAKTLRLAARMWRRYDLADSTQSGDRPMAFASIAGRRRVGPVDATLNGRLKRCFLARDVAHDAKAHRVENVLRLADAIGVARRPGVVCPRPRAIEGIPDGAYAVIHAAPMFRYKQWTASGWRALAAWLDERGLTVIVTGAPDERERGYLDGIWSDGPPVRRLDGRLDWPQLAGLLGKATVYVGPDTSVTHLAAAAGCPTVAIYGPTDPRLWCPWPVGGLSENWAAAAPLQRRGNVWLVQNPLPCLPCQLEGCERRLESYSACLDELPADKVIAAVDAALKPLTSAADI